MTIYVPVAADDGLYRVAMISTGKPVQYFNGYDFMGSVNWTENPAEAETMEIEYTEDYIRDLEAADYDCANNEEQGELTMTIREFVRTIWENDPNGSHTEPMDIQTARTDLANFMADGYDIPDGITPEAYAEAWNDLIPVDKKYWWIIDERADQWFQDKTDCHTKEESVRKARNEFEALSDYDKKHCKSFYVGHAAMDDDGCPDYDTMDDIAYIKG